MASITIRGIDDELKARLRLRSAQHGKSMEDEVRDILRSTLALGQQPKRNLAAAIRRRFAGLGGVELELPRREPIREPPDFSR